MARPYLLRCYSDTPVEMFCQACRQLMPFRLPDGTPYFEAIDLLDIAVEVEENHLALCPTCAAKWHHARATTDAEVQEAIAAAQRLEIRVTLAGEKIALGFVQMHLEDLRTIIGSIVGEDRVST
jgi:hypothetical protein